MADLLLILFWFSGFAYVDEQQFYLSGEIQTSQTGGQPFSDTSSYGECSLVVLHFIYLFWNKRQ